MGTLVSSLATSTSTPPSPTHTVDVVVVVGVPSMAKEEEAYNVVTSTMFVLWNMCSSVGLILVNKWLLDSIHLSCILLLASVHLTSSWVAVFVMMQSGYEVYKPMPTSSAVLLACTFFFTVAFFNWSLMLNSVGTYQLFKLLVTPLTAALQYVVFGKATSRPTMAALAIICVSVAFVSVSDVSMTLAGLACAVIAVASSSFNSLWTKSIPTDLGLSAYQLNYHIFPITAAIFACASLVLENDPMGELISLFHADMDPDTPGSARCISMLLTCAMAASLNLSSARPVHLSAHLPRCRPRQAHFDPPLWCPLPQLAHLAQGCNRNAWCGCWCDVVHVHQVQRNPASSS